nr:intradiol ring-cleavage dioxygenase [uncultured Albidiferax sp.]
MPIEHQQQHDHGLGHDLHTLGQMLAERRRALRWLAVGSVAPLGLMACGGGDSVAATTTTTGTTSGTTTTVGSCSNINSETAGPYPGDGTNSANGSVQNALLLSGIHRSDIRSSIVSSSTTAAGIVLTVTLTLVNTSASCASLAGYAIYLWHCDRDGKYSMYDLPTENYLRGVQVTDSNGSVTFTTAFPGCYSGRMPHIHFEVYASLAAAVSNTPVGDQVRTSQIALPTDVCSAVYATSGYATSVANLAATSFARDNVFSDGTGTQMATVTGSTSAGYAASLVVGISA